MKSPTRLAPNHNLKAANERAAQVITAMAEQGHITEAMAKLALASPAQVVHDKGAGSINYAADYVMDMLDDTVGAIDEDIVVTTTHRSAACRPKPSARSPTNSTPRATNSASSRARWSRSIPTARVKALVGGRNYADSQFNRAVAAKRQPGSAFKPFVYLAALEKGLTARHGARGRADHGQGLEPGELFARIFRPGDADQGALAVAQHGRGAARAGSRAEDGRAHRASARHRLRTRAERFDRARHVGGHAARAGLRLCRLRQWRHRRAAARHRPRAHRQRQAALRAARTPTTAASSTRNMWR